MDKSHDILKKENREAIRNYQIGEKGGTASFYPRYIQLEHTNRCNARCIMCNHFFLGNRGSRDLDERIVEKLRPILPYCELIMLNGDGEPFLFEHLERCVKLYKSYGILVSTNTNLCASAPEDWKRYGDCFDYLNISCDGCTEKTFESIRKGLRFRRFLENLDALKREKPDLRLNMDFVLMKENLLEAEPTVRFAWEHGFSSVHFNLLGVNPRIGNEGDSVLLLPNAAAYCLGKALETGKKLGIQVVVPEGLSYIVDECRLQQEMDCLKSLDMETLIREREQRMAHEWKEGDLSQDHLHISVSDKDFQENVYHGGTFCSWALERCYIDLTGNVSTCCFNVHHYMGNLHQAESFDEIWNGEAYRRMRLRMAEGILPEWCSRCTWYSNNRMNMKAGREIPDIKSAR